VRPEVIIHRINDNGRQTLGLLTIIYGGNLIFICKTLELPYKDNQPHVSSIPMGTYTVKKTFSMRFNRMMWEVINVPGRTGIRIYSANFARQLNGSIALGSMAKDLDIDGDLELIHSGQTMLEFDEVMGEDPFTLTIMSSWQ
jgi:hypothetical protein